MQSKLSFSLAAFICAVLLIMGTGIASAQITDVFSVNYFRQNTAAAPAAIVSITNPGLTYGTLCAEIYVFDQDQQLSECCGCIETHNGLRTLSVRNNLTDNPLTSVRSDAGVIKIVSASLPPSNVCDPTNIVPRPNLRAWATHVQPPIPGNFFPITETEFSPSTLGAAEFASLQAQCSFIAILGSGHGICTCGTGD